MQEPSANTGLRARIRFWFEDVSTPAGRAVDLVVMVLIILACALAVALTYVNPGTPAGRWLSLADHVITTLFIIEYALRLWSAPHRLRHVFKIYSIIDLIAILPALSPEFALFRVFRLLRIFRLVRFLETREFFFGTIRQIHLYILRVAFTLLAIPFVAAGLIYRIEQQANPEHFGTFFDAFYFSVVTLTTVGFGDMVPRTEAGRAVTILMIAAGIIFIPWQVKNLIAYFLSAREKVFTLCPDCGQEYHELDAKYCKRCGRILPERVQE